MSNRFNFYRPQATVTSWRDKLEQLRAARQELQANWQIMSEYERQNFSRELDERRQAYHADITAGAIAEWNSVLDNFVKADRQYKHEQIREFSRWDPNKLLAEMALAEKLVKIAVTNSGQGYANFDQAAQTINQLYAEAKATGDEHKIRGTAEVIKGVLGQMNDAPLEVRTLANRIAKGAENDLRDLRNTPEMVAAEQAANEALKVIRQRYDEFDLLADEIGGNNPEYPEQTNRELVRALWRFRADPETKTVTVLAANDPRVTNRE